MKHAAMVAEEQKPGRLTVGRMLMYILLVLGSLIMIMPLYWMLLSSMKGNTELFRMPPTFWPEKMMLVENYGKVLNASASFKFTQYYVNSVGTGIVNTIMSVFTSSLVGYVFAKYQFKFRNVLFMVMMACMMIPYETLMVSVYKIMIGFGWTNTYLVLTVPYFINIFGIFLMRQFMVDIPDDYLDAAEIDGCGQFRTFFSIILPLVKPALSALCIFMFMSTWNSYMWPLISVHSKSLFTLPVGLSALFNDRGRQIDMIMAASTLSIVPICVVFALAQKQFVKGITMAGIKG
ncbi:MAG: carbohydrate ABC transporter permease [Candidatus Limiplasma sp.]|nr:carbohydrate ABC transporter permease [Candidatus Limiplasma sp.]